MSANYFPGWLGNSWEERARDQLVASFHCRIGTQARCRIQRPHWRSVDFVSPEGCLGGSIDLLVIDYGSTQLLGIWHSGRGDHFWSDLDFTGLWQDIFGNFQQLWLLQRQMKEILRFNLDLNTDERIDSKPWQADGRYIVGCTIFSSIWPEDDHKYSGQENNRYLLEVHKGVSIFIMNIGIGSRIHIDVDIWVPIFTVSVLINI